MRRVDPKFYDKKYYLHDCGGYQEFKSTWGSVLEPRLQAIAPLIPLTTGQKVLDIGCGRGELAFYAARLSCKVVGIDYSKDAINLANLALKHQPKLVQKNVRFQLMNAKSLDFPNKSFDAVIITETLEHLYPEELNIMFGRIIHILKPSGFVFIHTSPSRWFNDFTYRLWCYPISSVLVGIWHLLSDKHYGNLPPWSQLRTPYHRLMHVNEPTYFSLRYLFRVHNLNGRILSTNVTIAKPILSWKDRVYNSVVYLNPLSFFFPFNILWGHDYYAVLKFNENSRIS